MYIPHFFAKATLKTGMILAMLGIVAILSFAFINAKVSVAQSIGGPTAGQRFTIFNSGGNQTLTQNLGTWAFCMLVEDKIVENGGNTNHSCRIDGNLNSTWTLVSYVGNKQDGQCSAFCTGQFIQPTGTIIEKATKDGVAWDSPPFAEVYDAPYGTNQTATLDLPQTFTNMQTGVYTVRSVTPPAGVALSSISGCGTSLPCSATLAPGGTLVITYNFVTEAAPTGTIKIKATKDGAAWDSPPFKVNSSIPGSIGDVEIDPAIPSQDIAGAPAGMYTYNSIPSNQPALAGVAFQNVNGSSLPYGQNLTDGGVIEFTFNFETVVVIPPAVPTLVITPSSATVQVGGNQQFTAVYDPDGSGPQYPLYVTNSSGWSSSNNSVASVSSTGMATGASAGSATITASYSGLTASASLTVTAPTPTFVVTPSSASVAIGGTRQFVATYDPDGSGPNSSQDVTTSSVWSPSDASKVTVNNGLATRIGNGMTSITASYSGLSDYATLLDPASIRVVPSSATLDIGETIQLSAMFDPDGSTGAQAEQDVTTSASWSSNRPSVVSVNNTSMRGLVTAGSSSGWATISTVYSGLMSTAWITVTAPPPPPDPELLVSCSASPVLTITGQPVVWTAVASGGTGSYSSLWSGSSPLGGKTSNPVTVRYSTTGTKTGSVRVTSGSQVVTQSCSTSVTVETPPPPPTATLSASPGIIDKGNSSTLTWSSTNADSCTAMGGFDTEGAKSGSKDVSPSTTSDYQISCEGPGGLVNSNVATVTVISATASISASPSCVQGGGSTKISWSATQVASCDISGPGLSSSQISGSQTVNITGKSTYTIACRTNGGSTVTKQVIVDTAGCWSEF